MKRKEEEAAKKFQLYKSELGMKITARRELFIVLHLLLLVSGVVIAFESKNTSEDNQEHNSNNNNNYNIDNIDYIDYHQKLAPIQNNEKFETHSNEEEDRESLDYGHRRQCSEATGGKFSPYDYAVVIAMLAVSLKIGLFYGFCHKGTLESSASDFMLGTQMGLFPVTLSLTTSFVTAIELLGNPAEMFFYGSQFSLIGK